MSSEGAGDKEDLETLVVHMDGSGCPWSQQAEDAARCHMLVIPLAGRAEQTEMAGKLGLFYAKASSTLFYKHGITSHCHLTPPVQPFREEVVIFKL